MMARNTYLTALALAVALFFTAPASAKEAIYSNWLGQAIGGYDPVAYFTAGKPVEGNGDFTAKWKGADWRFATAANRDLFIAMPEKYAPKYGGYCAYAVAQNSTAKIDPTAWATEEWNYLTIDCFETVAQMAKPVSFPREGQKYYFDKYGPAPEQRDILLRADTRLVFATENSGASDE